MKRVSTLLILAVLALSSVYLTGCGDRFLDPTQIGRFRPVPAVNVILDSLGVAEEATSEWAGAGDPKPIDVMVFNTDYVLASGDVLRISIFELLQDGITYIDNYVVTETGKISIPEVGVIEVAGLTEEQVEEEIKQILSPGILKDPLVTTISLSSQRRTFSILGNGVPTPGRYEIPRYDYRLNDALATAGVAAQFNISYVYVTRAVTGDEMLDETDEQQVNEAEKPEYLQIPEQEMLEIIAPSAQMYRPRNDLIITSAEIATDRELAEAALPEGFEPSGQTATGDDYEPAGASARQSIDKPINENEAERIEWVFKDGKWIPVAVGKQRPGKADREKFDKFEPPDSALKQKIPAEFDWDQLGTGAVQTRVIKIPTDKLAGGDSRYNVVIRPGDTVHVPVDIIGEFVIIGNVNSQGYINLTGRAMTLKMAVAAAGGLGPLAWPKRCEVTRRIGKNKEETVMVDLDKIARGEEPDFFIKPNDLINVGTHPTSRWRAVLRNAFRATYGFGFIYDRNFADRDYGTSRPIPNWF